MKLNNFKDVMDKCFGNRHIHISHEDKIELGIYQLENGNRIKITKIVDNIVWFYFTKGGQNGSSGLEYETFIKYFINEYGAIKV